MNLCTGYFALASLVPLAAAQVAPFQGFEFADLDGDGRLDVAALAADGRLTLHLGLADGRYEDVTLACGLGLLEGASCVLLADLDGDGDVDLFAGSAEQRVWLNAGSLWFVPADSGLAHEAFDFQAQALDLDSDGRLDLLLRTESGERLFHNRGGARFERVLLPTSFEPTGLSVATAPLDDIAVPEDSLGLSVTRRRLSRWLAARNAAASGGSNSALAAGPAPSGATNVGSLPLAGVPSMICAGTIVDQATSQCIAASSVPTLGELYPLSMDFNVSAAGNVGVGTLAPVAKLDVAGAIRASGALDTLGLRVTTFGTPGSAFESSNVVAGTVNTLGSVVGATVSGGGYREIVNGGPFGPIVNDRRNRANDDYCTVAGGMNNLAGRVSAGSSSTPAPHATVSGGRFNAAYGADSVVGGGYFNFAEAPFSTVAGGESNRASGYASVALGGEDNDAVGDWSVAAGRLATAGDGCFVFADSTGSSFVSTAADQFLIRAAGGVGIGTASPGAPLDVAGSIRASGPLVSTQITGTAPLNVVSTTKVTNLNADSLDGLDSSAFSQLGASIESSEITNGTLVDADIAPGAAIAGGKINPNFGTQALAAGDINASGVVTVGLGAAEAPLHVFEGSAGAVTANSSSVAVLERSGNNFLQLLAPDANEMGVLFGNPTDGAAAGAIVYNSTVADGFAFRVAGNSTKMVITPSGNVGIGVFSPSFLLHVDGSAGKPGGGSWSVASDARLKTNVKELDGALEKLLALHGVTYEYKDPASIHELDGEQMGFLAQEVERVFPQWVETGADGYKRLSVRGFEALTVEALREVRDQAEARTERDAARIASLEAQMAELKALVQASLAGSNAR